MSERPEKFSGEYKILSKAKLQSEKMNCFKPDFNS